MDLDSDMLMNILSRLPVKSLIRLTIVCKYWLSIIRSTEFATIHYATRRRQLSENRQEYDSLLTTFEPACSISILSYENLTFKTAFKIRPVEECEPPRFGIQHRNIITDCFVYGSCNGLFLIQFTKGYEHVLLLWNPATREVFCLPRTTLSFQFFYVGFGYDDVKDDYKVVCFTRSEATETTIVQLYSLATNSWKLVDVELFFSPGQQSGVYGTPTTTGRKHHWVVCDYELCTATNLLSFDIVDEMFVVTPLPVDTKCWHGFLDQGSSSGYPTLYCLDGSIENKSGMHVWVLKEYGSNGYWDKREYITFPHVVGFSQQMLLWKNRKIVFSNYTNMDMMTWYDLLTGKMKSLHVPGDICILGYTESLISIANFIHRPPPPPSTIEYRQHNVNAPTRGLTLQQQRPQQQVTRGGEQEEEEEVTSREIVLMEEDNDANDDDDDNLSVDSAFYDPGTDDVDNQVDERDCVHRERLRFFRMSYCLREVNQPLPPNRCEF